MTEGDMAFVIIQVDLVEADREFKEVENIAGVAGTESQAEFYISKRSKTWPQEIYNGKSYPYWTITDTIVVA